MAKDYNVQGGIAADLNSADYRLCYRAQLYPEGVTEANSNDENCRSHLHFSSNKNNRLVPIRNNVATFYYGYNPLAVFIERSPIFRVASLDQPRPIKFSKEELKKIEIIEFKVEFKLRLFDLNSDTSFCRHNLKMDADEFCSSDLSSSQYLADQIFQLKEYDGVIYRTRQGMTKAVVLFDTAAEMMEKHSRITRRISALTMFEEHKNSSKQIGITIVDAMQPDFN